MEKFAEKTAEYLLQIKAIKLQPSNPFTWASGWKSPIYCDSRKTLSFPEVRSYISDSFTALVRELYPQAELIAGVATGAIAHGALAADKLGLPLILRALEIYELTGEPKSKLMASGAYKKSRFEYDLYCLLPERAELYAAIDRRVDAMMQAGLLVEVENMVRAGRETALRKANVIGYEELLNYLDDRFSLDEAVARIKQNTRRYAKRQITWFRHQLPCAFFEQTGHLREKLERDLRINWAGRKSLTL